jgi:hypothetical protein
MSNIITIDDICARYRCERHKAASIMRKLPYFRVGKQLFCYERDLEHWEQSRMEYPAVKTEWKHAVQRIERRKAN